MRQGGEGAPAPPPGELGGAGGGGAAGWACGLPDVSLVCIFIPVSSAFLRLFCISCDLHFPGLVLGVSTGEGQVVGTRAGTASPTAPGCPGNLTCGDTTP